MLLEKKKIMARFARNRRKKEMEQCRPLFHFYSPDENLNDPNGLCFWRGNWHLFYQGYPPDGKGAVHWGHIVSSDLIHWQDLPYAINPGPEKECYSGSSLVEDDRVIVFYYGVKSGLMAAEASDENLESWKKINSGPVIPLNFRGGGPCELCFWPGDVYDPCLWKKGTHYYALSGGSYSHPYNQRRLRGHFLFRSKDLKKWEYLHEFVDGDCFSSIDDDGACPYFWPIGKDKYILTYLSHTSGARYLIGTYDIDNDKFLVESGGNFAFGAPVPAGLHAPSATPDGRGGVIIIFNINTARSGGGDFYRIMSLPRRLFLHPDGELGQEPAGNIDSLRDNHIEYKPCKIIANQELVLDRITGSSIELDFELDVSESTVFELKLLLSANAEEYAKVSFYHKRGIVNRACHNEQNSVISLDTSMVYSSNQFMPRPPETGSFRLPHGENLKLSIFIDKSIIEVFANSRQCLVARVHPTNWSDDRSVSLLSRGADAELIKCNAWTMTSIYNGNQKKKGYEKDKLYSY